MTLLTLTVRCAAAIGGGAAASMIIARAFA